MVKEGSHFTSRITPNLVCKSSRASMLTVMLPLTPGVIDNGIDLPAGVEQPGFAGALEKAGYDTAFIGKAHFATANTFAPTGSAECLKSSEQYPMSWTGPYMGFKHVELSSLGHIFPHQPPGNPLQGRHYERWLYSRGEPQEVFDLWKTATRPNPGAAQTWSSALPVACRWASDVTRAVCCFHQNRHRALAAGATMKNPATSLLGLLKPRSKPRLP